MEITKTITTAHRTHMAGEIEVCNQTNAEVALTSVVETLSQRSSFGKPKDEDWSSVDITGPVVKGLPTEGTVIAADTCLPLFFYTLTYDAGENLGEFHALSRSLRNQLDIKVTETPVIDNTENPSIFTDQDSLDIFDDIHP